MAIKPWMIITAVVVVAAIITIIVLVVVLVDRGGTNCDDLEAPPYITIRKDGSNLVVSWYHISANDGCATSYEVEYTINNGEPQVAKTDGESYTFSNVKRCTFLSFFLFAVNDADNRGSTFTPGNYTEMPEKGPVTDIELSPSEAGLEVTWNRPTGLEDCIITYQIVYSSDIKNEEKEVVSTEDFLIPYCFRAAVNIYTYAFNEKLVNSERSLLFTDRVSDVRVRQSDEDIDQMVVTWNKYPTHDTCSVTYEVRVIPDIEDSVGEKQETPDLTATFSAIFGANFFVTVIARSELSLVSSISSVLETTLDPKALGPVQNGRVDFTGGNAATVSWQPPNRASQYADLNYQVTARNEQTGAEMSCIGKSMCSVNLPSYCPRTVFSIREVSGITAEFVYNYDCKN